MIGILYAYVVYENIKKCLFYGMMGLAGFAYSGCMVSSFSRAKRQVLDMGFSDDSYVHLKKSEKKIRIFFWIFFLFFSGFFFFWIFFWIFFSIFTT